MALAHVRSMERRASHDDATAALVADLDDLFAEPDIWLATPNVNLGGETPHDMIDTGRLDAVRNLVNLIRHVGIS